MTCDDARGRRAVTGLWSGGPRLKRGSRSASIAMRSVGSPPTAMRDEGRTPPAAGGAQDPGHLDSWGEIAAHLHRSISTVQRWEKHEGLPVHRIAHAKLGSVYATTAELDAWYENRSRATPVPAGAPAGGRIRLAVLPFQNLSGNPDQ